MVCEEHTSNDGNMMWSGQSYRQWIQHERQQPWQDYVRSVYDGSLWPGMLEIHQAARSLKAHVEIFVKEGDKYKRISQCGTKKDDEPAWKLEYQDGCHYEPLVECLMQGNDKKKVWKKQEDDIQQAANEEHEPCKSADEDEEESQVKIVLGNISSWKLHNDEAFAVM